MNNKKVLKSLNNILELELAGVVKYTHYAFMVQGPYRLSVVEWLRAQAQESLINFLVIKTIPNSTSLLIGGRTMKNSIIFEKIFIVNF